jgi:hypothetical protein
VIVGLTTVLMFTAVIIMFFEVQTKFAAGE